MRSRSPWPAFRLLAAALVVGAALMVAGAAADAPGLVIAGAVLIGLGALRWEWWEDSGPLRRSGVVLILVVLVVAALVSLAS